MTEAMPNNGKTYPTGAPIFKLLVTSSMGIGRLTGRLLSRQLSYTRVTMYPSPGAKAAPEPDVPRPSASIMILSPTNQLLLLHRVRSSSAFASAHVFPGGVLSEYHERVPAIDAPDRHRDSETYRLAAVREAFEECGILLAKKDGQLVDLAPDVREAARKSIHGDKVRFTDWLSSIGAEPDLDNVIPFTRWITPPMSPRRFSAQMYLYLLPLDTPPSIYKAEHDGGLEHTDAQWDDVSDWVKRTHTGEIIVYEPQIFLLTVLADYLTGPGDYAAQREALLEFIHKVPTGRSDHPTSKISWADKVMGPYYLPLRRADDRIVLALEGPGPELEGTQRGGDYDRVVLVKKGDDGPRESEVRWRHEVVAGDDSKL